MSVNGKSIQGLTLEELQEQNRILNERAAARYAEQRRVKAEREKAEMAERKAKKDAEEQAQREASRARVQRDKEERLRKQQEYAAKAAQEDERERRYWEQKAADAAAAELAKRAAEAESQRKQARENTRVRFAEDDELEHVRSFDRDEAPEVVGDEIVSSPAQSPAPVFEEPSPAPEYELFGLYHKGQAPKLDFPFPANGGRLPGYFQDYELAPPQPILGAIPPPPPSRSSAPQPAYFNRPSVERNNYFLGDGSIEPEAPVFAPVFEPEAPVSEAPEVEAPAVEAPAQDRASFLPPPHHGSFVAPPPAVPHVPKLKGQQPTGAEKRSWFADRESFVVPEGSAAAAIPTPAGGKSWSFPLESNPDFTVEIPTVELRARTKLRSNYGDMTGAELVELLAIIRSNIGERLKVIDEVNDAAAHIKAQKGIDKEKYKADYKVQYVDRQRHADKVLRLEPQYRRVWEELERRGHMG